MKRVLLAVLLVASCGSATAPSKGGELQTPAATAAASLTLAETICAPPAYGSCGNNLQLFLDAMDPGTLLAVCDFSDGTGDVIIVESANEADAEAACSGTA